MSDTTYIDLPHAAGFKQMGAKPLDDRISFDTPMDRRLFQLGLNLADETAGQRSIAWDHVYRGYAASLSGSTIDLGECGGGPILKIKGVVSPIAACMIYRREFGEETGRLSTTYRWVRCGQNSWTAGEYAYTLEDGRYRVGENGKLISIGGSHRATLVGAQSDVETYTTEVEPTDSAKQNYKLPADLLREWRAFIETVRGS